MDTELHVSSPHVPAGWLQSNLDVVRDRLRLVIACAVGVVAAAALLAWLQPGLLPPVWIVGGAIGVAAILLAVAIGLAVDASDLVVRGDRHVHAAGTDVDLVVSRDPSDVDVLLQDLAVQDGKGLVKVALSPASRKAAVPGARASALAERLARDDRRVLLIDLTRGATVAVGLSDVVSGQRTLADAVRFDDDLYLARLAVGSDPDTALQSFPAWAAALPSDLDALVVALPSLATPGVVEAAGAMDVTYLQVEVGRSERVDLIASLDAVDTHDLNTRVVLVQSSRHLAAMASAGPPAARTTGADDVENPDGPGDAASRTGFASVSVVALEETGEIPLTSDLEEAAASPGDDRDDPDAIFGSDELTSPDDAKSADPDPWVASSDETLPGLAVVADVPDDSDPPDTAAGRWGGPTAEEVDAWNEPTPDDTGVGGDTAPTVGGDGPTGEDTPATSEQEDTEPDGSDDADDVGDQRSMLGMAPAATETPDTPAVGVEPSAGAASTAGLAAGTALGAGVGAATRLDEDTLALEVARTSAALQQLAEQMWFERDRS